MLVAKYWLWFLVCCSAFIVVAALALVNWCVDFSGEASCCKDGTTCGILSVWKVCACWLRGKLALGLVLSSWGARRVFKLRKLLCGFSAWMFLATFCIVLCSPFRGWSLSLLALLKTLIYPLACGAFPFLVLVLISSYLFPLFEATNCYFRST